MHCNLSLSPLLDDKRPRTSYLQSGRGQFSRVTKKMKEGDENLTRSQLLSQLDSVKDGNAVPKLACKKFVPLSAAVSACVEKVVLGDSKNETVTPS